MYHIQTGFKKDKKPRRFYKLFSLAVAFVMALGVVYPLSSEAQTSVSASVNVNGERSSTLAYGSDAEISWTSSGLDECVVTPGNWNGLQGNKPLTDITSKQTYKLSCKGKMGTATAYATFAVAAPTFEYLRHLLSINAETAGSNPAIIKGMARQISQAESKYQAQQHDDAQKFLELTIMKSKKMAQQDKLDEATTTRYGAAVGSLITSWTAPEATPDTIPDDVVTLNQSGGMGVPGVGVNCGGGYPGSVKGPWGNWGCNYPLDNTIDNWGMYNRQSVSYTAFKVHADFLAGRNGRDMPYWGGIGNANQWDDNARRAGIPVDSTPLPGAIAVSNSGYYGHVMYVEQVSIMNGQQAVYVSDYNAGWDGRYREYWRYTTGLVFIHF